MHVLSLHENKTINVDPNIPVDPNNITTLSRTGVAGGFFRPLDAALAAAGQPYMASLRDEMSIGRSRYDGMNLTYRQRNFHKTDITVNYTLARAVGYDIDGSSFRYYPRDPKNHSLPRSLDRRSTMSGITLPSPAPRTYRLEWKPRRSCNLDLPGPFFRLRAVTC